MQLFLFLLLFTLFIIFNNFALNVYYDFDEEFIIALSLSIFLLLLIFIRLDLFNSNYFYII